MSLLWFKNGQSSIILRVRIPDSNSVIGAGKTGLTFNSAGLIIATIADNEAAATAYTQAGGTIETITTLGTYAAPTATKCRFKEVDAVNFPGVYELQIADARWAVSNARYVTVSMPPVSGLNTGPMLASIQLTAVDPQAVANFGLTDIDATITSRLAPTVASRTLDIAATGEAGVDFDNIKQATAPTTLTNVTVPNVTTVATTTDVTNDVGITQTGADKVWSSAARTLTSFGTLVTDIWASATRTLTDLPAALLALLFTRDTGETGATAVAGSVVKETASSATTDVSSFSGAAATQVTAIKAHTDLITVSTPMYLLSLVGTDLNINIKHGDDCKYADGRALFQAITFTSAPSLTGATVTLRVQVGSTVWPKAGTVDSASTCHVDITSAESLTNLGIGKYRYDLEAVLVTSNDIVTIASGWLTVIEDVR